jgi:ATP-dependent helicase Lhr and Lhr-like helicase
VSPFDALHPALRYHVVNTLGWTDLRSTQRDAILPILAGENVLLLAPTAGGKTEAAMLPLLSRVASEGWHSLSVLYVCPLKALLNNLEPRLQRYASFVGLRAGLWHGDIGEAARRRMLRDPPEILMITPESLEAILISVHVDHRSLLGSVRTMLIDELHAFAGDDRGWHLRFLMTRLERLAGHRIQRIGLSATIGNPDDLLHWLASGRAGRVVGPARSPSEGDVTVDYVGSVANAVIVLSRLYRGERRLIFAESRSRVEMLASGLRAAGIRTFVSHASLSLDERRQAEAAFTAEPDCAIVATSTLELGLDVGDLDRVVQVGAPPSVASFLQRMGRTGRRPGTSRNCLLLATDDEELLADLAIVLLWREGVIEPITPPALPAHIYAQQVMALTLQEGGVTRLDLDAWLADAAEAVPADVRDVVIRHMLAMDILTEDAGIIGLGIRGEREFGRRHFNDLVAAFSSPWLFAVHHGVLDLGSIHPASLARSPGETSPILLLGGRSWKVTNVDWPRRRVSVVPAESGGKARWLGVGRMLSFSICRAEEQIITGVEPPCQTSHRATERLTTIRDRLHFVDGHSLPLVSSGNDRVTAWLFAGGLVSASVARAFSDNGLPIAGWNDVSVTVRVHDPERVSQALQDVNVTAAHPALPGDLPTAVKFGLCLPPHLAEAVIIARTSRPEEVARSLSRSQRRIFAIQDVASGS